MPLAHSDHLCAEWSGKEQLGKKCHFHLHRKTKKKIEQSSEAQPSLVLSIIRGTDSVLLRLVYFGQGQSMVSTVLKGRNRPVQSSKGHATAPVPVMCQHTLGFLLCWKSAVSLLPQCTDVYPVNMLLRALEACSAVLSVMVWGTEWRLMITGV